MFSINLKRLILSAAFILLVICNVQGSGLEELMPALPDDTVMFVGTSGTDELEGPARETILWQIWEDDSTQNFVTQIKNEIKNKFLQDMPSGTMPPEMEQVLSTVKTALQKPTVIGAAVNMANKDNPFYGFGIIETRGGQIQIARQIIRLESSNEDIVDVMVGDHKMRSTGRVDVGDIYWGWVGSRFVVAVNDRGGLALKNIENTNVESAPGYLSKVEGSGDALAVYTDIKKLRDIMKKATEESEEPEAKEALKIFKMLELAGLGAVKNVRARVGFSGEDIVVDELISLESYRRGVFNQIRPVGLMLLNKVDSTALNVCTCNVNIPGIYDTILEAVQQVSPDEIHPMVVNGIGQIESQIHFGIRRELLSSLAGPVLFYSMPAIPEANLPGGMVGYVRINDANSFEKSTRYLSEFVVAMSRGQAELSAQERDGRMYRSFLTAQGGIFQIEPTWTIVDDYAVFGMNFPLCRFAAEKITATVRAGTIGTNAGFQEAQAAMPANAVFFKYSDTRRQFEQLMQTAQMFWPMAGMLAGQAGIRLPATLPSLSHIAEKMGPTYSFAWFDQDGLRMRYKGVGLEQGLGTVAVTSAGTSALLPALRKARDQAKRVASANNIRQIIMALTIYADRNNGNLPESMDDERVLEIMGFTSRQDASKVFESPLKPADFDGPSYIMVPVERMDMTGASQIVLIYENPQFYKNGINVGFLDTHVEYMQREDFLEALNQTNERLQMIEQEQMEP